MSNLIRINNEYANWIKDLSLRFRQSQMKAAVKVNRELLKFYFVLGADIVNKQAESKWGEGFFRNLSQDLRDALPDVKGLSETNLKYTKYFYLLYSPLIEVQNASETFSSFHPQLVDDSGKTLVNPQSTKEIEKHPQLVDELETILSIPWGHHRFIIDKCNGDTRKYLIWALSNTGNTSTIMKFLLWNKRLQLNIPGFLSEEYNQADTIQLLKSNFKTYMDWSWEQLLKLAEETFPIEKSIITNEFRDADDFSVRDFEDYEPY